jgi:iron complex outermembrane recepter protein
MSFYLLAMLVIVPTLKPAHAASDADSVRTYTVPSISVSSTRAVERQTPVVFSEITRADLQARHTVRDVPDLLSQLPSMMFYSENGNGIGYTNLTMRGFDQRRIAVLVNGIPQNDPEDHNVYWINFPDMVSSLQSIQVQRGAGMVNYGAAAIGGSVNMTTSNFADRRFVRFSGGVGLQEGLPAGLNTVDPFDRDVSPAVSKASMEVSSGLIDGTYAVYARLSKISSNGYRDRSWADLQSWFVSAVRFDSTFTTQVNVFGGPIADGLAYTGLPKAWALDPALRRQNLSYWEYADDGSVQYATQRRDLEIENFSQPHAELLNDWQVADGLEIKSSLFYYTGDGFFDYDASWATPDMFGLPSDAPVTNGLVRAYVGNRHGGWIPRVVWTNAYGQLTAGVELRLHRSEHWGKLRYADGLPSGFDPEATFYDYRGERDIMSAFARQMWDLDDVTINTEVQIVTHRYGITHERQRGTYTTYATTSGDVVGNGGDLFNVRYTFVNPRLGVNWNIDASQSAMVSLAYTSREPRRNNLYAASEAWYGATPRFRVDTTGGQVRYDFTAPLVRPEHMLDLEVQYAYRTTALQASVTGYWMEFTDELVKNGQRDIFGLPIEGNAPRTRHIGIELEASYALIATDRWQLALWGNATISRNRIVDYDFVADEGVVELDGNSVAGFPDLLANAGVRVGVGGLRIDGSVRHIGAFRTDNFGNKAAFDNVVDAATVVNLNAMYDVGRLGPLAAIRLRLQVQNLFDTIYVAGGNGTEFFPAAERNWFVGVDVEL